ncbi:MAG: CHAT domain-containing tetratricopeptide repeat protein [Cyclobacteriaceae bacterium]
MKYAFCTVWLAILFALPVQGQSVDALIKSAEERLERDDWVQATKDFKSILEKYGTSVTPLQKAKVHNDLGYLSLRLLNMDDAEYHLNLSILGHEEAGIPDKTNYAKALQHMSELFLARIQYDLAKSYIDQAIQVIVDAKGRESADYALARIDLAQVYEELGYYDLAYDIFLQSHESLKDLGAFSPEYAEACNHLGRILIRQGQPARAEEYINESAVIYKQLGNDFDVERAESLEGLGNFYEQLGRYEDAEKTLLEALEIKRGIPNEANILIIETLNDLGILYRHLGDDDKSEDMFLEVVEKCEAELTTDHQFYATAKNNLATIAMQKGEDAEAKVLLEEALAVYDTKYGPNHPLSANVLNNLARVERQLGESDVAEKYYKRVLALDERLYGKNHPDYATTLMNLAILYSASGREAEADTYYLEALAIRKNVLGKNHPTYYRALENVGLHAMAQGKMMDAEAYFREAIEIQIGQVESIFAAMPFRDRENFYDRLRDDVDRYNYIAFGLLDENPDLIKNIFDYQIKTKTLLFTPSGKIEGRIVNGSDQGLRNEYFEWRDKKQLLANYYRIGEQRLQENNISLVEEESSVAAKERGLVGRMEEFQTILPKTAENWSDVQKQVKQGEAIVELVKVREFKSQTNDSGIIFGFTNLTQYLAIVFTEGADQTPSYAKIGDRFRYDDDQFDVHKNAVARGNEEQAFDLLWGSVHDQLGKVNRVRVTPDGIYNKINPNALKSGSDKYLIDEYFVSYQTSCKDLFREEFEALSKKSMLFGNPDFKNSSSNKLGLNPLLIGELEINSLAAILQPKNWDARIYAKTDASELRVRSAFSPTILHIATHGYYSKDEPFFSKVGRIDNPMFNSGLFLAGASRSYDQFLNGFDANQLNDGILTTYEVMALDLKRTKLVVLSAPEASATQFENRDGVYGLQRAFIVAGARNLLTNFSRVDTNARSELIVLFYHKFIETEDADESLRFAQQKLRTKYADPRIWGSFMLVGNG